ncbi:MAG: GDSL-type esterase/lipase family protein [Bifidobacteriaceae bacterium]|nr:GDSL-type esterase/lipase family protein [Bifidobacteriaceae bacterium]
MAEAPLQICVVGSELVAGVGDPQGMGWVGRLAARSPARPAPAFFPLAAPMESTLQLEARWAREADLRFLPGCEHRLVVAPGAADLATEVSPARSRLALASILDGALRRRLDTMVVGPPPGRDALNAAIADLSRAYRDVTTRRGMVYVDTFTPLVANDQWLADMAVGDGEHPGATGYALIAWLVANAGWHQWLGIAPPAREAMMGSGPRRPTGAGESA